MNTTDLGTVVACSQCIQITDTTDGNSIIAQVIDECPGCDDLHWPHSVDLDPAAAQALDPNYLKDGMFPVSWTVVPHAATP